MRKIYLLSSLVLVLNGYSQSKTERLEFSEKEHLFLNEVLREISEDDQKYRAYLMNQTTDDAIIAKIDSVMDAEGVVSGMKFARSLKLSLSKTEKDSLNKLQSILDLKNHLLFKGVLDRYGYLPEDKFPDYYSAQIVLLLHPPNLWQAEEYLKEYASVLKLEVLKGNMLAKEYALFFDNIRAKILRIPQLYGTNEEYDASTNSVLPPIIKDLNETNMARKEIGLPELKEGEYRLKK